MNMLQIGDLIFVRGSDLIGEIITWAESGKYSHVAIYAGNNLVIEAQGYRLISLASLDNYPIYDVGKVDMTDQQRSDLLTYAMTQRGLRYDWFLIFIIAVRLLLRINIPYKERAMRICSTFARDCFEHESITLTDIENCTPEELGESSKITIYSAGGDGCGSVPKR